MLGGFHNAVHLWILCTVLYLVHFVFKMLLSCTMISKEASPYIKRDFPLSIIVLGMMHSQSHVRKPGLGNKDKIGIAMSLSVQ